MKNKILKFVKNDYAEPEAYGVIPASVHKCGNTTVFLFCDDNGEELIAAVGENPFGGELVKCEKCGVSVTVAHETHENAVAMRKLFPFTAPTQVLGKERSFGVGDRLGIAIDGHIKVFEKYPDFYPVFAQQSMRELTLTDRTYKDVLDCVTWAVFRHDFTRGFGADGDHLKRAEDVKMALDLGFSMITLDCSDHIVGEPDLASVTVPTDIKERYEGKSFDIGDDLTISFDADKLRLIYAVYGEMISFASDIYHTYFATGEYKADFELSIDETATPTDPAAHYFVANELALRGVKPATVAPRFCGEFQKGIDYIGDIDQFEFEMKYHSAIARHFGYKLSIHSGSDKFSVFPIIGRLNRGVYHVKTAGTNWLEAMRVVAKCDPTLYREVHEFALESFDEATKYYHVTTDLSKIPALSELSDEQLPELFNQNDPRQLIHITYGLILQAKNEDGTSRFRDRLYRLWKLHAEEYEKALVAHIGHHIDLLKSECK